MGRTTTHRFSILALVIVVGVVADVVREVASAPPTHAALPRPRVTGGAATMAELLDRFLAAVRAKDRGALEELRVTEEEYRKVIVPGNVEKGAPPQVLKEDASEYFWSLLNTRSVHHRENILRRHGGKSYALKEAFFEKGTREYAWFTAHRRLALTLVDESGEEIELNTGSIAEVDGRFKFVSFIRD
jgi:hypothetical protein